MAKEKAAEEEETLSESQRLALLESAMGTNRTVLIILSLLIIISLSVTVTLAIVTALTEEEPMVDLAEIDSLKQQLDVLKADSESINKRLTVLNEELPKLRRALNDGSAPVFQKLLVEQEESAQAFIRGVKEGMYDLARMIPGSRTWLELYTDKMDRALAESQQRERELTRIKTGEPLIEP